MRPRDLLLLPLLPPLQRGQTPLALLLVERIGDGEAATHAPLVGSLRRHALLLGVPVIQRAAFRSFLNFVGEMLPRCVLALAASFSFRCKTRLLFNLALVGFLALLDAHVLGDGAECGISLGALALLGLANLGIAQRPDPRILLFI